MNAEVVRTTVSACGAADLLRVGARLTGVALMIAAGGCAADSGGAPAATVRDSAGIRIVETARAVIPDPVRLDGAPGVVIGVLEGEPAYQLHDVQGVLRLPDGRIVVANGGTQELRYYGADGRHLRTVGGEGHGPGEFARLAGVAHGGGDTVIAFDPRNARVTYFAREGELVGSRRLPSDERHRPEWMELGGRLGDGLAFLPARLSLTRGAGTFVDTTRVFMLGDDSVGASWREILAEPYVEFTVEANELESGQVAVRLTSPVFTTPPALAVAGDRIALGPMEWHGVEVRDVTGRLVRVARYDLPRVPITDALMDSVIAAQVAAAPQGQARFVRSYFETAPRPAVLPARDDILLSSSGIVWLEQFEPMPRQEGRWTVFDAGGAVRCEVVTPVGFDPMWLGDELLLGMHEDDLGVERVRVYRIAALAAGDACPR